MATSVSQARNALLQLGSKTDASTKKQLDIISSALESLGNRVTKIENILKEVKATRSERRE
jgi:hypothetical protein